MSQFCPIQPEKIWKRIKEPEALTISDREGSMGILREAMAVDILCRYNRREREGRHALLSAFDYTKDKLELESGDFTLWRNEEKVVVARELMHAAEEFFFVDRDGACGAIFCLASTLRHRLCRASTRMR